jgi:hypothetical protein
MSRCLQIGPNDGSALDPLPAAAQRANCYLAFDVNGQPIAAAGALGTSAVTSWVAGNLLSLTSAAGGQAALGLGAGSTIAAAGTYALPGGLIVKWGTSGSIASAGNAVQTFATAFPTAFFGAVLTPLADSAGYYDTAAATGFKIHNTGASSATFFWVALGN